MQKGDFYMSYIAACMLITIIGIIITIFLARFSKVRRYMYLFFLVAALSPLWITGLGLLLCDKLCLFFAFSWMFFLPAPAIAFILFFLTLCIEVKEEQKNDRSN